MICKNDQCQSTNATTAVNIFMQYQQDYSCIPGYILHLCKNWSIEKAKAVSNKQWHWGWWPDEKQKRKLMAMAMRWSSSHMDITNKVVQSWWGHGCLPDIMLLWFPWMFIQELMTASKEGGAITWILLPPQPKKDRPKTIACGSWRLSMGTTVQPVKERSPSTGKGRQLQAAMEMDKASVHL